MQQETAEWTQDQRQFVNDCNALSNSFWFQGDNGLRWSEFDYGRIKVYINQSWA